MGVDPWGDTAVPLLWPGPMKNPGGVECGRCAPGVHLSVASSPPELFCMTLSTFADATKLCGAANMLEGRDAILRDAAQVPCSALSTRPWD